MRKHLMTLIPTTWHRQRPLKGPLQFDNTLPQDAVPHAETTCPISKWKRFAVEGERITIAPVVTLFIVRGPAHIVGLIITIVVNAIQRVFRAWPVTHISQERLKRIAPLATHANTSTAVANKTFTCRCSAAVVHVDPRSMFWRASQAMRRMVDTPEAIEFVATAGLRVSGLQVCDSKYAQTATVAPARDRTTRLYLLRWASHRQVAELLSGNHVCSHLYIVLNKDLLVEAV